MPEIQVYTDGSCLNNGRNRAVGGVGIHFPNGELRDLSKVYRRGVCTNQKTELYAILVAICYVAKNFDLTKYRLRIMTDSRYSVDCITKWVPSWIKRKWMTTSNTPVQNRDLIEAIYRYYLNHDIQLVHVSAHTGRQDPVSLANQRADELAVAASNRAQAEKKSTARYTTASAKANKKSNSHSQTTNKKWPVVTTSRHNAGNFIVELVDDEK